MGYKDKQRKITWREGFGRESGLDGGYQGNR